MDTKVFSDSLLITNSSLFSYPVFHTWYCRYIWKTRFFWYCPTALNLKSLDLPSIPLTDGVEFASVLRCIKRFPNVERLHVSISASETLAPSLLLFKKCKLLLRWITFTVYNANDTELKLIEFLLESSPVLETLSVSLSIPLTHAYTRVSLHNLMQLHRASTN